MRFVNLLELFGSLLNISCVMSSREKDLMLSLRVLSCGSALCKMNIHGLPLCVLIYSPLMVNIGSINAIIIGILVYPFAKILASNCLSTFVSFWRFNVSRSAWSAYPFI
jgi:hypothetical protein